MQIAKSKLKQLIKEEIVNVKLVEKTDTDEAFSKLVECSEHLAKGRVAEFKKALKQLNKISAKV
jgi:hypothetical protein|tara:strand:+ start:1521 stop:1712 length:192 start_codon:yes stop_codon:yes gene_type:complete